MKNEIIKLGNYACNFGQAYTVVDSKGIAPCVLEQHGAITGVIVKRKDLQNAPFCRKEI